MSCIGGRVCLCSSVCRVNRTMAHSWCSVTHVWNEWIPVKGEGTVVSYQRFATLNDIALSNQVVQNLGLWEISSRGTLDTVHPMLGEGTVGWPSSQSQKSWDRGVLLMCVWGDPGIIHLQVGAAALQSCVGTICRGPGWWNGSSQAGHPGGKPGIETFRKEVPPSYKKPWCSRHTGATWLSRKL